jgi:hypothetical protein
LLHTLAPSFTNVGYRKSNAPKLDEEEVEVEVVAPALWKLVLFSGRGISIGDWDLPVLHSACHCEIPSGLPYSHCCSKGIFFVATGAARLGDGGQHRHVAGETMAVVQAMSCRREDIILHFYEWSILQILEYRANN